MAKRGRSKSSPVVDGASRRYYLGVDPGIAGAMALLDSKENSVTFFDMPTQRVMVNRVRRNRIDHLALDALVDLELSVLQSELAIVIEGIVPIMRMSGKQADRGGNFRVATTNMSLGVAKGAIFQALAKLYLVPREVYPISWKKEFLVEGKEGAVAVAKELYPGAEITLQKHHARAEALLLAEYGRREDAGELVRSRVNRK